VKLIGLSGTNGSGKDTVGHVLAEQHGYLFVTLTEALRQEARNRGWAPDRRSLRTISAEWRRESGLGVLVDKAVEAFQPLADQYSGLVMASLRNPGEAERLHELGGTVVWVDADPRIRYQRISQAHRGRDEEDNKTYEEFLAEEQAEMHSSGDAATLDMSAVRDRADVTILNESDLTALGQQLPAALGL